MLRSLPWDLGMITPLTNGAGGNDHLDLPQLRAGHSLADYSSLPERLESSPAIALDHLAARRTFQLDGREINGHQMEMSRIDTVVVMGATELWTVSNTTISRTTSMSTGWRFKSFRPERALWIPDWDEGHRPTGGRRDGPVGDEVPAVPGPC